MYTVQSTNEQLPELQCTMYKLYIFVSIDEMNFLYLPLSRALQANKNEWPVEKPTILYTSNFLKYFFQILPLCHF